MTAVDLEKIDDKSSKNAGKDGKAKETKQQEATKARIATLPEHLIAKDGGDEDEESEGEEYQENAKKGEKVDISPEFKDSEELKMIQKEQTKREMTGTLFSNFVFFVSREVPRESLELCITSFGGLMGWDGEGSPYRENDRRITHHIVDRPKVQKKYTDREYLQPQWVYDSINAKMALPVKRYVSGAALPPHLSPFINDHEEGYIPAYREELDKLKSAQEEREEAKRLEEDHEEDSEDERLEEISYSEGLQAEANGVPFAKYTKQQQKKKKKADDSSNSEEDSSSSSESDDSDEEEERESAEISQAALDRASRKRRKAEALKQEEKERAIKVMPKKAKRLYKRMQHGIAKKREKVENLERKRRKLEEKDTKGDGARKKAKKSRKRS